MTWLLWVAGACVAGAFAAIVASQAFRAAGPAPRRRRPVLARPA